MRLLNYIFFIKALLLPSVCIAIMAGSPPDGPQARIDENTVSSHWASAVSVVNGGSVYSGVVIAPEYVLTASHVVGSAEPNKIMVILNIGDEAIKFYKASEIIRFPSSNFPYDDLAIIHLAKPIPEGVTIPHILPLVPKNPIRLTLVGYGGSGFGTTGVSIGGNANIKRIGYNMLDVITDKIDQSGHTSRFFLYDFDSPFGNGDTGGPSLGNETESIVSSGDSGSPAYAEIGGQLWLVGINTFVNPPAGTKTITYTFGHTGGGMLLSDPRFIQWIEQVTGLNITK